MKPERFTDFYQGNTVHLSLVSYFKGHLTETDTGELPEGIRLFFSKFTYQMYIYHLRISH